MSHGDIEWARWQPSALNSGVIRQRPEDFRVEELLPFVAEGEGEHLWVHLRKTGENTEFVARALARAAGVPPRSVGYAGLKDRHAVTTQWFSVHSPKDPPTDWIDALPESCEVLSVTRGRRKIRTGSLRGNRFSLVVRDCAGDPEAVAAVLESLLAGGVPNYFGEQRFGRGRANLERARELFAGDHPVRDRKRRGLYLSAARSWIFNLVLDRRLREGTWDQLLDGEVLNLDGSHSWFHAEVIDDALRERYRQLDIHPTGPLWGQGELDSSGVVAELEREVASDWPGLAEGLAAFGLKQERRALRLRLLEMDHEWLAADVLRLELLLPAGAYATTVLRELGTLRDAQRAEGEDQL